MADTAPSMKRARTESGTKDTKMEKGEKHAVQGDTLTMTPSSNFTVSEPFLKLLLKTPVQSLKLQDNKIFVCQRNDKVVDVWKGLITHNFLSVPVLQKTGNKYYGFVDLADIVMFIVESFGDTVMRSEQDYWQLLQKEKYFQDRVVNDIMKYPLNRRNPFHPVPKGYSLFAAIEVLAREHGLHRVPVLDETRRLVGLVTQSQLIRFLKDNLVLMGNKRFKPLSSNPSIWKKEVFSVTNKDLTIEAFRKMVLHNISGVACVDDNGMLVGNVSLRDLKAIGSDARLFWRLYQTTRNFISKERKETESMPRHPIFATPDDTLETVINILALNEVHRVYVVDSNHHPIGIVSLKDILLEIITIE